MGKICSVLEPDGGKSIYDYDCMGSSQTHVFIILIFHPLPSGISNRSFFSHGSILEFQDGEGYETSFAYDASGNLKSVDYAGEKRVEYEYNALGYLVKIHFPETPFSSGVRFYHSCTLPGYLRYVLLPDACFYHTYIPPA